MNTNPSHIKKELQLKDPQLIVVDSLSAINELGEYLADKDFIAYDCETTGLSSRDEVIGFSLCAEDDKAYYVILQKWNPATQKLEKVPHATTAVQLIASLPGKLLVMHNGTFDCMMAESYFKVNLIDSLHTDTMILAHLLDENRRVGLKELAKTYFGEDSTKEQEEMKASIIANGGEVSAKKYELYKGAPHLIAKYGAQDALLTFKLFYLLVPELYEQGLEKFFYEDESMPLLRGPTYHLNTTGLRVDMSKLQSLEKQLEAECLEAKHFIMTEIQPYIKDKYPGTNKKNTFNIGATQQLSWLLFERMELEFVNLTDAGKDMCKFLGLKPTYTYSARRDFIIACKQMAGNLHTPPGTKNGKKVAGKKIKDPWVYMKCDKKTLQTFADKYKWIKVLLEYQRKQKILNTYVKGIEERVEYGIIKPSFLQHGTTSGRYSSRNPNFQNLPRDDKRIKECIIPRPNKVFVGADYSQLEPRVFAYFSKDERLLATFKGSDDFYSTIGMAVYNKFDCTPKKDGDPNAFGVKYKKLRDWSKVIALASTYGATARQLASTTGKSVEATQEDIDAYFERFPGVKQLMLDSHEEAKEYGFVLNLFGRPRRMPEARRINKIYGKTPHAELPYEFRNILNLAVNHRIQSTGASICNRAAIRFLNNCKDLNIEAKLCCQVHDSLIVECNEQDAEEVSLLLEEAMINAVQLEGIALEAIPKIGHNFAEV